jgi:hypothetical protein
MYVHSIFHHPKGLKRIRWWNGRLSPGQVLSFLASHWPAFPPTLWRQTNTSLVMLDLSYERAVSSQISHEVDPSRSKRYITFGQLLFELPSIIQRIVRMIESLRKVIKANKIYLSRDNFPIYSNSNNIQGLKQQSIWIEFPWS